MDYALIVGIVLCVLGVFMKLGWLNFLIARYEWFQKAIRKKDWMDLRRGKIITAINKEMNSADGTTPRTKKTVFFSPRMKASSWVSRSKFFSPTKVSVVRFFL